MDNRLMGIGFRLDVACMTGKAEVSGGKVFFTSDANAKEALSIDDAEYLVDKGIAANGYIDYKGLIEAATGSPAEQMLESMAAKVASNEDYDFPCENDIPF